MARDNASGPQAADDRSSGSCCCESRDTKDGNTFKAQVSPNGSHPLRDHSIERHREEENAPKKPRACMGVLYFNQRRYDSQKPPLCGGWRRSLPEEQLTGQLPSDSVPGGDFKYVCVGYSTYDEEGLKRAAARRSSEADAVVLPYCEGLEVISAAAMSRKPELMSAGGPDLSSDPSDSSRESSRGVEDGHAPVRQRPGRSFVPGGADIPEGMTFDKFRER